MKLKFLFVLFILATACSEPEKKKKPVIESETPQMQGIETLFNTDEFEDKKHLELLKELKICDEFQKDTSDYIKPACSPRFFRILPMKDDAPVDKAFLFQITSKVSGVKLRRLVCFVRERGILVKTNTFIANLIGVQKSSSHYNDLLLRFNDNVDGEIIFYNCLFTWNGNQYVFKSVELIEGATWRQRLKPEFKDSVSNDIRETLIKNEMIL